MISKDLIDSIKTKLLNKEKTLKQEKMNLEAEDSYKAPDRTVGNSELEDEAYEDSEHERTAISLDFIKSARLQISKAIKKLSGGSYGKCEVCGERIDPARLKAYPEATKCLKCSSKSAK